MAPVCYHFLLQSCCWLPARATSRGQGWRSGRAKKATADAGQQLRDSVTTISTALEVGGTPQIHCKTFSDGRVAVEASQRTNGKKMKSSEVLAVAGSNVIGVKNVARQKGISACWDLIYVIYIEHSEALSSTVLSFVSTSLQLFGFECWSLSHAGCPRTNRKRRSCVVSWTNANAVRHCRLRVSSNATK